MLMSLSVRNYALIDALEVEFYNGLSTITGETGAGKSILLGALALVLGKRADLSVMGDKTKKCVVEADFDIANYRLEAFFEENDLDYEKHCIIRREILPSGKSRSFINDTPARLQVLNELSNRLIDIHSQHQTLQLADDDFQFRIIDSLAGNAQLLETYATELKAYRKLQRELELLESEQRKAREEADYNRFVLEELTAAKLVADEQDELEQQLEKLSHFEEISQSLQQAIELAETEEIGLRSLLYKFKYNLEKMASFSEEYRQFSDRIQSLYLEFIDLADEVLTENDRMSYDPDELERVSNRLQLLFDLQKKYKTTSVKELIDLKNEISQKVQLVENASEFLQEKRAQIAKSEQKLNELAAGIRKNRKKSIRLFVEKLHGLLQELEMKNTVFKVDLQPVTDFRYNGMDKISFLISSNAGKSFEPVKKAASGGEMSRIMLAVKTIMSAYTQLPSIIFDEIDTGVSGEVSNRIADVMLRMSQNMQVIAITHLPQIAARGVHHYRVFKETENGNVRSDIRLLSSGERVEEIAEMLGGRPVTDSAVAHAEQLLGV